jgi:hypothetical protein
MIKVVQVSSGSQEKASFTTPFYLCMGDDNQIEN